MLFISTEDFFEKVSGFSRLTREDETRCAILMKEGNTDARNKIVESYLLIVASHIKRLSADMQTLEYIYMCISSLEKLIDKFDFQQDSETFIHRLSLMLNQTAVRYIASK